MLQLSRLQNTANQYSMSKVSFTMETVDLALKKRVARYLDATLYISALLLISSLLEIIKS
jgi:hypothetical protein